MARNTTVTPLRQSTVTVRINGREVSATAETREAAFRALLRQAPACPECGGPNQDGNASPLYEALGICADCGAEFRSDRARRRTTSGKWRPAAEPWTKT